MRNKIFIDLKERKVIKDGEAHPLEMPSRLRPYLLQEIAEEVCEKFNPELTYEIQVLEQEMENWVEDKVVRPGGGSRPDLQQYFNGPNLEEFFKANYKPSRYMERGTEYMNTVLVSGIVHLARVNYTLISCHDSKTNKSLWYVPPYLSRVQRAKLFVDHELDTSKLLLVDQISEEEAVNFGNWQQFGNEEFRLGPQIAGGYQYIEIRELDYIESNKERARSNEEANS